MYVVTYGDTEGRYVLLDINSGERPLVKDGKITFEAAHPCECEGDFEVILTGIRDVVSNSACPRFFIYLPGIEEKGEDVKYAFNLDFLNRVDMIVKKGHWFSEI